uniref:Uncharacterized protein n=1 Tax=Brassica oleracea var. oleracea TaxID=109376 RepID=A0A0D3BL68_BRAOL
MAEKRFEYRYATEDELEEMKQREFSGWMFTYFMIIYTKISQWSYDDQTRPRQRRGRGGTGSIYRSHDDQTRPRQRRGRGGTGSQSRDSTHFQDSPSPHSSYHPAPAAAPAPAPAAAPVPAPAAAPVPAPPDPPGRMSVAELVQPIRERVQRMDQPYDVLGPRQATSDFHSLPYRQSASVVSSVCKFNWNSDETLFIYHHFVHKVMDNYGKHIHEWKKKWEISKSVLKKNGRLAGLGHRLRSVPPSSAPPPFVDTEVLTAQLKDKDDRISLLVIQMAAQQAGYEAQKRLNQQMMEMMKRIASFLGIYRGTRSSKFSEGSVPRKFPMKILRNISSELPRIEPSESPSIYPEEVLSLI